MKTLLLWEGDYGQCFFDGDELVCYMHENDARYRKEYMGSIMKWARVEVKVLDELTAKQKEYVERFES